MCVDSLDDKNDSISSAFALLRMRMDKPDSNNSTKLAEDSLESTVLMSDSGNESEKSRSLIDLMNFSSMKNDISEQTDDNNKTLKQNVNINLDVAGYNSILRQESESASCFAISKEDSETERYVRLNQGSEVAYDRSSSQFDPNDRFTEYATCSDSGTSKFYSCSSSQASSDIRNKYDNYSTADSGDSIRSSYLSYLTEKIETDTESNKKNSLDLNIENKNMPQKKLEKEETLNKKGKLNNFI